MTNSSYVVGAPPPPKRTIPIPNGGAHRGAALNLDAYVEFNKESKSVSLSPVYADPQPGRALALKEEAARRGVSAGAMEVRVQDLAVSADPRVLNLDRASAIADVLRTTETAGGATLGYLLVRADRLWGLRFVLEPRDVESRRAAVLFFDELANASERGRSAAVIGGDADPAHALIEPAIRRWFASHMKDNLSKIVAGLEPVSNVFELTEDGRETLPLMIAIRSEWSDPVALAQEVVAHPDSPLRKGVRFIVAEVVRGEGIRLHEVRRRTDGRVTVGGAEVVDRASVEARAEAQVAREEELRRQAAQARARAERATLSRTNPVWTTD